MIEYNLLTGVRPFCNLVTIFVYLKCFILIKTYIYFRVLFKSSEKIFLSPTNFPKISRNLQTSCSLREKICFTIFDINNIMKIQKEAMSERKFICG